MATPESQRIRDRIRAGESGPEVDRVAWEADVARVYELEEQAEHRLRVIVIDPEFNDPLPF